MRNLTITREKTSVACLVKMKVYIEDAQNGDLNINGVPCRFLGKIKNGRTETFLIDNEPRKVYVIAGKMSKGYCNDFYELPAGEEDIALKGKNYFNPATGNSFQFDGVPTAENIKNSKKNNIKGIIILVVAMAIGSVVGTLIARLVFAPVSSSAPGKTFETDDFSITLTEDFEETVDFRFDKVYASDYAQVAFLEESFDDYPDFEDCSLEEYAELCAEIYDGQDGREVSDVKNDGDLYWVEMDMDIDGMDSRNFVFMYETDDSFWSVQVITTEKNAENHKDEIMKWASSVEFE